MRPAPEFSEVLSVLHAQVALLLTAMMTAQLEGASNPYPSCREELSLSGRLESPELVKPIIANLEVQGTGDGEKWQWNINGDYNGNNINLLIPAAGSFDLPPKCQLQSEIPRCQSFPLHRVIICNPRFSEEMAVLRMLTPNGFNAEFSASIRFFVLAMLGHEIAHLEGYLSTLSGAHRDSAMQETRSLEERADERGLKLSCATLKREGLLRFFEQSPSRRSMLNFLARSFLDGRQLFAHERYSSNNPYPLIAQRTRTFLENLAACLQPASDSSEGGAQQRDNDLRDDAGLMDTDRLLAITLTEDRALLLVHRSRDKEQTLWDCPPQLFSRGNGLDESCLVFRLPEALGGPHTIQPKLPDCMALRAIVVGNGRSWLLKQDKDRWYDAWVPSDALEGCDKQQLLFSRGAEKGKRVRQRPGWRLLQATPEPFRTANATSTITQFFQGRLSMKRHLDPIAITLLWLVPAAAMGAEGPQLEALPLQSIKSLEGSSAPTLERALRTNVCSLATVVQGACGSTAAEDLRAICEHGALALASETQHALKPLLVGPSVQQCPPELPKALRSEAALQREYSLCSLGRTAAANMKRCGLPEEKLVQLQARIEGLCSRFTVEPSTRDGLHELLTKLADPNDCVPVERYDEAWAGHFALHGEQATPPPELRNSAGLPFSSDFQSVLLNGLASFLLERARAESVAYVVDQVADVLCKGEPPAAQSGSSSDARALFPETCKLVIEARRSGFPLVPGQMLHRTVTEDLGRFPERLAGMLPKSTQEEAITHCGFSLAPRLGNGLFAKKHPLQLAMGALRYVQEEDTCKRALGLEGESLPVRWVALSVAFETAASRIQGAQEDTLTQWARDPQSLLTEIKPIGLPPSIVEAEIEAALKEAIPLAVQTERAVTALRLSAPGTGAQLDAFRSVVDASIALVTALLQEGVRMQPLQGEQLGMQQRFQQSARVASGFIHGNYADGVTRLISSGVISTDQEPFQTVLRFSPLIVNLATARTSEEMVAAFEAVAAPVGGWRLKRQKRGLSLSLGARVGFLSSYEKVPDHEEQEIPGGWTMGPWLPLGLDLSVAPGGHSLGLFAHGIDLGAVANARLSSKTKNNVSVEAEPHIGLVQLVSPGLSVYWGISNSPFVLSFGASVVPSLRPAVLQSEQASKEERLTVVRYSLGLGVDIPLIFLN